MESQHGTLASPQAGASGGAAERLLAGLNPQQRAAVESTAPALLIVAGAGSGKTRVLTHRIAYLLATHRAWPSQILAITFTNKAATEMRDRVGALLGQTADGMWISTFHSACVRILRREAEALGFKKSFTIYDTHDSRMLLKRIVKEQRADMYDLTPASAHHRISMLKNELQGPDDLLGGDAGRDPRTQALADVYREYQRQMLRANALDFDDILVDTVALLDGFPEIRERYQRKFRHILVDEYQDTNRAQYQLIRLLVAAPGTGDARSLTVVGDSDQSIYAFRGADLRNIVEFEQDFPGTQVVLLEQNYRSTQHILDAANAVISHNVQRRDKRLWSDLGDGAAIVGFTGYSAHDEAQFVADEIERLRGDGFAYRDIAVFFRTNSQSRALEEILVRASVPYRLIGGTKFYERAEVKDALAYLVALVNPADELSVRRILNVPKRGIGPTTEQRLVQFAAAEGITLVDALGRAGELGLGPKVTGAMTGLADAFAAARTALGAGVRRLSGVVGDLLEAAGLVAALRGSSDPQDQARGENVEEFVSQVVDYEDQHPDATLLDFLTEVSLTAAADEIDDASGAVSLMTLHTAKGLEFRAAFLTGLEEGLLPHRMSVDEPGGVAEERRLLYVGITRARERLYLSLAVNRAMYGQPSVQLPSRFLDDIPPQLIEWRQPPEALAERSLGSADGWGSPGRRGSWHGGGLERPRSRSGSGSGVDRSRSRAASGRSWDNAVTSAVPHRDNDLTVSEGDRIRHATFGEGTVRSVRGEGKKQVAEVEFDSGSRKKLVVALAPVERIER